MKSGNRPIKILVLGSTGMAGHTVFKYLSENPLFEVYGYKRFNIAGYVAMGDGIQKTIENVTFNLYQIEPDYVINCIGLIKQREGTKLVDHLETNGMFPVWLSSTFPRVKIIHLSSDCVFSGTLPVGSTYKTHDFTDACDNYGISKAMGENCWKLGAMVLRTSIIGIEEQNNKGLVEWVLRENKEVLDGYTNHLWNGVLTTELARKIEQIITEDRFVPELYQLGSPELVSKYRLVEMITAMLSDFEKTQFKKTVKPVSKHFPINRVLKSDFSDVKPLFEQFLDHKNFMLKHNMDKRP